MNARGITEIVVLSAGLSAGLINQGAFTVMVMMALITTMMALPLLRLLGSSLREPSATTPSPIADAYAGGDAKTVVP
jgi:Kef-type K+ transport system membrane component KefB